MPWLILLHIASLLCWCGALMYLPALIVAANRQQAPFAGTPGGQRTMPRAVYTLVATPAALCAIGTGTVVFLVYGIVEVWLLVKLALVAALVTCHLLLGLLVAHAEKKPPPALTLYCGLLAMLMAVIMVAIVWLVLAKPLQEL